MEYSCSRWHKDRRDDFRSVGEHGQTVGDMNESVDFLGYNDVCKQQMDWWTKRPYKIRFKYHIDYSIAILIIIGLLLYQMELILFEGARVYNLILYINTIQQVD